MIFTAYEQTEPATHEVSLTFHGPLVPEVESLTGEMFKPDSAMIRWGGYNLDRPTALTIKLISHRGVLIRYYDMDLDDPDASDGQASSFEHAPEWVTDLVILRPGVGSLIRDFYDVKGWKQP